MVMMATSYCFAPFYLTGSDGVSVPPSVPLIISSQDNWDPLSCQLQTPAKPDPNDHTLKLVPQALQLLRTIDKPLAVLSICGPYCSGKSYFISHVLGCPRAFKLGHSMQACTRGIWMSTTVLECPDFSAIVIDTEGIDAVGASKTFAMSLLTLTTLLSSFLIYNSNKVPQKSDLEKMRCFSQLSTSLLSQCGESMSTEAKKAFIPHFLWLLRDVALKMTSRDGRVVGPTEFLHTRILTSESGELTTLGKSLVDLFPSLECATLPIPSIKREVIRDIFQQQDKLKPAFNAAVESLVQQILGKLSPKKAVDGTTAVNGKALAALAESYVEAVNRPGAVPDLDQGWQAVVRLQLKEVSHKLVREYWKEMEEALEGNLPMEEGNLLRIHRQILNMKKSVLREEIRQIDPLHSSDGDSQPLLDNLEHHTVQWKDGKKKVTEGALYQFMANKYSTSKTHCQNLFERLLKKGNIQKKVENAVSRGKILDITREIGEVTYRYNREAVGPAAREVLESGQRELSQLSDILKKIPGPVENLEVVGQCSERIKLKWDPPKHNPEAVKEYIVYKRAKTLNDSKEHKEEWAKVMRTKNTWAVVKNLKALVDISFHTFGALAKEGYNDICDKEQEWKTEYAFKVMATNSIITGVGMEKASESFSSGMMAASFIVAVVEGLIDNESEGGRIQSAKEEWQKVKDEFRKDDLSED